MRKVFQVISLIVLLGLTACGGESPAPEVNFVPLTPGQKQAGAPATVEVAIPMIQSGNETSPVATPVSPVSQLATEIGEDGSAVLPSVDVPADVQPLVAKAAEILTGLSSVQITAADVRVAGVEAREWPNAGLGCPREDMMYAAMITPGYLLQLQAGGKRYEFHTDSAKTVTLCAIDGQKYNQP